MNSPSSNSGGSVSPVPPPPPIEVFVVLPDGSCTPATPKSLKLVLRQARNEATKKRRIADQEKADELQRNLEDRQVAMRLLRELAESDRDQRRMDAKLLVRIKQDRPNRQTSSVEKRAQTISSRSIVMPKEIASSWVIDDRGMRGVHYNQTYIGRKSPAFYRGAARDRWEYEARDEAVLRDAVGEAIIISNLGDDIDEIGAGWQAIEDATTRENGKVQIRIIVAFDADASDAENVAALKHFCESVLAPLGLSYSAVLHRAPYGGDVRNAHGHILTNLRPTKRIAPYCWAFADHVRGELDGKNGVQMLRHLWAHSMSEAAEQARSNRRYTGLGYGTRGLDLEAGEHLGEGKSAMVARGTRVWAWERNRIKNARNAARRAIRDADQKIAALTKVRDGAIAQMAAEQQQLVIKIISASPSISPQRERLRASSPPAPRRDRVVVAVPVERTRRMQTSAPPPHSPVVLAAAVVTRQSITLRASGSREAAPRVVSAGLPRARQRPLVASPAIGRGAVVLTASSAKTIASTAPAPGLVSASGSGPAVARPRLIAATQMTITAARLVASSEAISSERVGLTPAVTPRRKPRLESATSKDAPAPSPVIQRIEELLAILLRERLRREDRKATDLADAVQRAKHTAVADHADLPSEAATSVQADTIAPNADRPASAKAHEQPATKDRAAPAIRAARWRRARIAIDLEGVVTPTSVFPTRAWLEANPGRCWPQAPDTNDVADREPLAHLARIDAYVSDLHDGTYDISYEAMKAIKADEAWLRGPAAQAGLAVIRGAQQHIIANLAIDADRRPLDFARHGVRFWPRDLARDELTRLDRWAVDPGFETDVYAIGQAVRAAHLARDAEQRQLRVQSEPRSTAKSRTSSQPAPDGFGGLRDTPPPVFEHQDVGVRVLPFDKTTGKPTRSLLTLLRHCGEHPHSIAFADDDRLIGLSGTPGLIDPLIRMWRGDTQVQALVVATVSASRKAARPVYPVEHSPAIRALSPAPAPSRPPPSDHDLGIRR